MIYKKKRTLLSAIQLWIWILAFHALTTQSVCPNAFQETGQSDLPPVEWNGEGVSGGGTLYYCPGRIKCKFKCVANSDFSPSFYIDGQCLAVTEVSKAIPGATVLTNHPNYTLEFNCSSAVQLRCVNGENLYSPGYNLQELTNAELCGLMTGFLPGDSTDSPGSTPSNTTDYDSDGDGYALNAVPLSLFIIAVSVAVVVMVFMLVAVVCALRRKQRFNSVVFRGQDAHAVAIQHDLHPTEVTNPSNVTEVADSSSATLERISGSFSIGDNAPENMDTSSSLTMFARDLTSESRYLPDGEEEVLPFPTQMEDVAGNSEQIMVPGIFEY